jgi:hypothetical protein
MQLESQKLLWRIQATLHDREFLHRKDRRTEGLIARRAVRREGLRQTRWRQREPQIFSVSGAVWGWLPMSRLRHEIPSDFAERFAGHDIVKIATNPLFGPSMSQV